MTRRLWYSLTTVSGNYERNSLLRLSLTNGSLPLSFIRFEYTGNFQGLKLRSNYLDSYLGETPANGSWTMLITIQNNTAALFQTGSITFLLTGQVKSASPPEFYDRVNTILAPTISTIQSLATAANISNFNFWELMNWVFVSQYWLLLLDFGQSAPAYNYHNQLH